MSLVNFQKLQNRFDMLWSIIADKQAGTCQEISFRKGWIHSQEGYKYKILAQSQEILRSAISAGSTDSEYSSIGAKLLAIQPHLDGKIQNLVDYRDIEFFYSQVCKKPCEIGRLLHILFTEDKDAEIFKALANILKNKYALITYFFFLKDSSKYQVVRPNNFMERFAYIDAPAKSAAVCSWENYTTYNAVLSEVRSFLLSCLDEDVTLTDAHSFLWMFWLFNEHTVATPIIPVEEQLCTGVYTSAKEGRKILYYTTKYERDTKLRNEAIRRHGHTCAVCGFKFEETYGDWGKDYIEIHHIKPLFTLDEETEVNPETDLVPLCSNCHRMIHHKRNAILTVAELKMKLKP